MASAKENRIVAKKQYPLRIDPELWSAVERWANDELRSVNGQLEFIIRESLKRAGRLPKPVKPDTQTSNDQKPSRVRPN